jgi:methylated-DNA-[protein]-cysteine S-methyltransferase
MLSYKVIDSPIGELQILASNNGLRAVSTRKFWQNSSDDLVENENHHILLKTEKQLDEYFAGNRKVFDVKLEMRGTVFQINAWRELQKIPYGATISYGEQAARMGDAKKARAVGAANGRNPLLIIVPCHRVIGASGALTGYASGVEVKEFLLGLERNS